jgi:NAD+-dependent protein deacetylase SIR2
LLFTYYYRVLINLEKVGSFGTRADDVMILGDCDTGVRELADALGWRKELDALWEETSPDEGEEAVKPAAAPKSKDELLEEEIAKITKDVDVGLKLSKDHKDRARADFEKEDGKKYQIIPPKEQEQPIEKPQVCTKVAPVEPAEEV